MATIFARNQMLNEEKRGVAKAMKPVVDPAAWHGELLENDSD